MQPSAARRQFADMMALGAVIFVLVFGLVYLFSGGDQKAEEPPQVSTTFPSDSPTTEPTPSSTATEDSPGVWDRALNDRTLDLLRVGLIAFAAFIAGGLVQRVVLGRYVIKTTILELPDEAASVEALGKLAAEIGLEIKGTVDATEADLRKAASQSDLQELAEVVGLLADAVDDLTRPT